MTEGTSLFPGLRWLRPMAVSGSACVWQMDGTEGALDDLPVPRALRDRVDAWQAASAEHDDMDEDAPALDLDLDRFAAEGLAVAQQRQVEGRGGRRGPGARFDRRPGRLCADGPGSGPGGEGRGGSAPPHFP